MVMSNQSDGLIGYFAKRPVAANVMMLFILIVGIITCFTIQKQLLPNFTFNSISIKVNYPGASPQEVDEAILVKIENALLDVTEIKKSNYMAFRGSGQGSLQIDSLADITEVIDKVKMRVESIVNLPANMEPIQISRDTYQQEVIEMALTGQHSLQELKPLAKEIAAELRQLENVSIVELFAPEFEIAIEVEPLALQRFGLTIDDVAKAVKAHSNNFSSGQLRTNDGIVSIRAESKLYYGAEFLSIPVKLGADGANVLLSDIANVRDGFVDGEHHFKYNGNNGIFFMVNATDGQNMNYVASSVRSFVEKKNQQLDAGIQMEILIDTTEYLDDRLNMVVKNLVIGFLFVAVMLMIFLRTSLALWVFVGLPVSFLGATMLMPLFGVTFNIYSLFAFILVLGIVVDDAVIVGESAYQKIESGGASVENVITGVKQVATPVTFGVLTTITMFIPFLFASGPEQAVFYSISVVVVLCLLFSLIESKLILPAHIAVTKFKPDSESQWRKKFNNALFGFINGPMKQLLAHCIHWRWAVLSMFIAFSLLSYIFVSTGTVRVVPNPKVPHDFIMFTIKMNTNVSDGQVIEALERIEKMVHEVEARTKSEFGKGMLVDILSFNLGRTNGRLVITFVEEPDRPYDSFELSRRWREAMPSIQGLKSYTMQDDAAAAPGSAQEFGYLLYGTELKALNQAGRELITLLQQQNGIYDVGSTIDPPSKELVFELKPFARSLNMKLSDISHQLGVSFYGYELQRVLRGGEEVKVMVRYPEQNRRELAAVENAIITTPNGRQVKLGDLVDISEQQGVSNIRREAGHQSVYIWGSINEEVLTQGKAIEVIQENLLPNVIKKFPEVKTQLGGFVEEQQAQQYENLLFFVCGILAVYILLAVSLNSFVQPILIVSIIPFSLAGAIWGHMIFDLDISMMSQFGLIAAAGIVVNDSLVLTCYINSLRGSGVALKDAVTEAVCVRFRAVVLTSITTFLGVLPIMFETSLMTRFITPMAVALGFSVVLACIVTLFLLPCLYLILQDVEQVCAKAIKWRIKSSRDVIGNDETVLNRQ
jgi:multidrug efflux pump subunit AcrB